MSVVQKFSKPLCKFTILVQIKKKKFASLIELGLGSGSELGLGLGSGSGVE